MSKYEIIQSLCGINIEESDFFNEVCYHLGDYFKGEIIVNNTHQQTNIDNILCTIYNVYENREKSKLITLYVYKFENGLGDMILEVLKVDL